MKSPPVPFSFLTGLIVILLLQSFPEPTRGTEAPKKDEESKGTVSKTLAGYGQWCDDGIECDESNLMSTWNCNIHHTCECPSDRKGLSYDQEIKGCAIVLGFKCNAGDPNDKCVTNAECKMGVCTCSSGKTCANEVKPPPPAKAPKGFSAPRFDRIALGIQELGSDSTSNQYPYSLENVPTVNGGGLYAGSFFYATGTTIASLFIKVLVDFWM